MTVFSALLSDIGQTKLFRGRGNRKRKRFGFASFCALLLLESTLLQILTQLNGADSQPGQVASAQQSNATGSVSPPLPTTIKAIRDSAIPVAVAATPTKPESTVVVFHSPLRSYRLTQYFHSGHPALDMAANSGTPIYATTTGTVAATGYVLPGGGNMVKVTHPNGYVSYYAHMSRITAWVGQHVDNQTQIGLVGMTGWATGPHLHFMLTNNKGVAVNPLTLLR